MTLLRATDVRGGYGERDVVRGVSVGVEAGGGLAVLGPNGAGKSTLLRLLAGILPLHGGGVELLGRGLATWRRRELAQHVAYVPQHVHFAFPLSVVEIVRQGRAPHLGPWRPAGPCDHAAVDAAIARVGLERLRDAPVQRLSGGERQRVLLARALATEAQVLLLDEPATALDARHQLELVGTLRTLQASGVATVAVVHDWNLAVATAEHALVLSDGTVEASGPARDVLTPELFRRVFAVEVDLLARPAGPPAIYPRALSVRQPEGGRESG